MLDRARERFHKDLHTTAQAQHQVERGLLLDVVVGQSSSIFKLLPGEDKTLLIWRDAFLVLNLRLNVVDGVRSLDIQGDGLASIPPPSRAIDPSRHRHITIDIISKVPSNKYFSFFHT